MVTPAHVALAAHHPASRLAGKSVTRRFEFGGEPIRWTIDVIWNTRKVIAVLLAGLVGMWAVLTF